MNDFSNIQYLPVRKYQYGQLFQNLEYNGKVLNVSERKDFIKIVDDVISDYSEVLPRIKQILESIEDKNDEFHEIQRKHMSVMQSTLITMIDSMVISKYFILANKDYDKRFFRGKMKVVINEGFKKLYGFETNTRKNSEWNRLASILKFFPEEIKNQYEQLSLLFKRHSQSSSWWRDERNVEIHLDAEKLYASRCECIDESKVMMDSLKLFNTLYAVELFLTNMNTCLYNFLVEKYKCGELKEE